MAARKLGTALFVAFLAIAVAIAAFLAFGDVQKFLAETRDVQILPLAIALAATFAAYLAFTATLVAVARAGECEVRFGSTVPIAFVSLSLNNLLSTGGMGGLAIRVWGFGKRGIPAGISVAMSALTTLLGDAVMFLLLSVGLAYLLAGGKLEARALVSLLTLTGLVVTTVIASWLLLRSPERRARLLVWISKRVEKLATKAGQTGAALEKFNQDFMRFYGRVIANPRELAVPYALALLDHLLRCAALGCAFWAIGDPQHPLVLLTGFAVGIMAGAISLVPGGIGVVEGSMSAAFVFMGVELHVAAAAGVVFRLAYYVFPLLSVAVFFRSVALVPKLP